MMGDNTYDIEEHFNGDEWCSVSVSLKELRNKFQAIGIPILISPQKLTATIFEPNETRSGILTDIMKTIHPDDSFWISKSGDDVQDKCLQISKWFGLTTEASIVNGFGAYEDQLNFWVKVVSTAYELTSATAETLDNSKLDLNFFQIIQELTLSDSILEKTIDSANTTARSIKPKEDGYDMNHDNYVVEEILKFGELEVHEMQNGLEDLRFEATFGNFPTKRLSNTSNRCRYRIGSILKFYGRPKLPILWDPAKVELQNMFALQFSKKLQDIERKLVQIKDSVHRVIN